jgi:hypothetical protein
MYLGPPALRVWWWIPTEDKKCFVGFAAVKVFIAFFF